MGTNVKPVPVGLQQSMMPIRDSRFHASLYVIPAALSTRIPSPAVPLMVLPCRVSVLPEIVTF